MTASPIDPMGFHPPPSNMLSPANLLDPQTASQSELFDSSDMMYTTAGQPQSLLVASPFSTEDSPRRRRRVTRQILGHLATPEMSDTPLGGNGAHWPPLGVPNDFPHGNQSNQQRRQEPLQYYPYRQAQPGGIITTATLSPYVESSAVLGASPPCTSSTQGTLQIGGYMGGDGGTGAPSMMGSPNAVLISDGEMPCEVDRSRSTRSRGRKRRVPHSSKRRSFAASTGGSEGGQRTRKRPRPHSIDPAARDIPMRGKKVFTYGLTVTSLCLLLQSIIAEGGFVAMKINPMLGPSGDTLIKMGGLVTQLVRDGQWWRLLWAPFLHAGVFHLGLNLFLWVPLGSLTEPDWGLWRTLLIFVVGAVTGNLMSSCLDPYSVSVGASGGIFAVMAALLPYVIEFWHSIPRAKCLLALVAGTVVVGIGTSFVPFVDVYAHVGGTLGGLLAGFATITKWQAFTKPKAEDRYRYPAFRSNSKPRSMSSKGSLTMLRKSSVLSEKDEGGPSPPQKEVVVSDIGNQNRSFEGSPAYEDILSDNGLPKTVVSAPCYSLKKNGVDLENGGFSRTERKIGSVEATRAPKLQAAGSAPLDRLSADEGPQLTRSDTVGGALSGGGVVKHVDGEGVELPIEGGRRASRKASIERTTFDLPGDGSLAQPETDLPTVPRFDRGRKRSFRATLDPVNDHYGCTLQIWLVRVSAILLLIATWIPLIYFLFFCPECYEAPGQVVTLGRRDQRLLASGSLLSSNGARYEEELRHYLVLLKDSL
eukprot:GHVN01020909.1.p1 GENE.GHVN01020909.1~~GHVN01020909.1.p1  ORF type:complete len:759 (+),score=71.36 GHVN01020909.1:1509-3785(+)